MTIIDGLENNAWTQSEVIAALLENKARLEAATNQYIAVTSELREKNRRLEIDLVQNNAAHSELREQNIRYREKIRLQAHVIAKLRHKLEVRDRAEPIRFVPVGSPAMTQTNPGYMVIHCTQCKEEAFFVHDGANIKATLRVAGWICTDTERVCKKCLQKGFEDLLPLGCTINVSAQGVAANQPKEKALPTNFLPVYDSYKERVILYNLNGSAKGIAGDGKGGVFIADPDKNRVLAFSGTHPDQLPRQVAVDVFTYEALAEPPPNNLPKEEAPTVPLSQFPQGSVIENCTFNLAKSLPSQAIDCTQCQKAMIIVSTGHDVNASITAAGWACDGPNRVCPKCAKSNEQLVLDTLSGKSWRDRPSQL